MNLEELRTIYTELRASKKLSQAELSEKIHISEKFYSDIEQMGKF